MLARKALAGTAGAPKVYVEDVFSTYLYTGNASTLTITNNIDLSGEGGLVWYKARNQAYNHGLQDTERGTGVLLISNSTSADVSVSNYITSFNSDGFTAGDGGNINASSTNYASWTFRKAEKFFDVVTFTQSGTSGYQTINHNLGSVPGVIIIKGVGQADGWFVYHRSIPTQVTYLNQTNAAANFTLSNSVTSTTFNFNLTDFGFGNNATYVAYLFAHDAGGFGDAGDQNVISCGSYTGNGSTSGPTINLGWEPQWLLVKRSSDIGDWHLFDTMRGLDATGTCAYLYANAADAESSATRIAINATGFQVVSTSNTVNTSGATFIYIAIRRGPMKTPTTGTSVFTPISNAAPTTGCLTDLTINRVTNSSQSTWAISRLTNAGLETQSTNAETSTSAYVKFDRMTGVTDAGWLGTSNVIWWNFRRAPGFFDVVCYTGTGSATTVSHNLGVAPELVILKRRNSAEDWPVLQTNIPTQATLNGTFSGDPPNSSYFGNGTSYVAPTSTVFSVGTNSAVNASGGTYVAYLFASLSGVSKIGTYTGNGSSVTVTTNFQPRFILVKRTDSTGDWIVSDSARGLVAGDDPFLKLNSTAAEVTNEDWVDISSTSFTVNQTTNNANVNTGTYLYLAIA